MAFMFFLAGPVLREQIFSQYLYCRPSDGCFGLHLSGYLQMLGSKKGTYGINN